MNRFLMPVLAGLLSSVTIAPALAWGVQGHALVADVAQRQLQPQVLQQVQALLALEGHDQLSDISSWADQLRAQDPDLGRRSARWHYVNIAEQGLSEEQNCQYRAAEHCPDGNCVVAAIHDQGVLLADTSASPQQRLQALKFVVHFVGDVHQPMHAGYGHDKGGNDMQIQHEGHGSNLHAFWDSGMLRTRQLDNAQYLEQLMQLPPPVLTPAQPARWAENSCRIAITPGVYPDSHRLGPAYVAQQLPMIEAQLRAGGDHLADLLNTLLAPASARP